MKKYIVVAIILALMTALISGCTEVPSGTSSLPAGMGRIEVRVTDAPPEYGTIQEIWVTVTDSEEGVVVHKAATEEDGKGDWLPIPITGDNRFELLALKEAGVDALLGWSNVAPGKYTQIRMTIEKVEILFEGEPEPVEAKLPSGKLKFVRPFDVVDGETTIIMFDFIADKSVTVTGQGKVIFKPVVKLQVSGKEKPIELEYSLEATVNATAELSTEEVYSGKESVHLQTTGEIGTGKEARIVIPLPGGTTLRKVESISWWTYLVDGYVPHVDLVLDYDGDASRDDVLVAEAAHQNDNDATIWKDSYKGEDVGWIETFEGASGVYTSWAMSGNCGDVKSVNGETAVWMIAANNPNFGLDTLANFQNTTGKTDGSITINEETVVLALEIEIDNWIYQSEAYVDDIDVIIDGITYKVRL